MYSSNIGAAQMAIDVGTDRQKAFLAKFGMLRPVSVELPELGKPLYPRRLAADQHHDDRLRPRHRRQPAACRLRRGAPWSMAACMRRATLIKRAPDEVTRRPARDLGRDLGRDARAAAPGGRGRHRQVGRSAGLSRRRQDRHGGEDSSAQAATQPMRCSPPSSACSRSTTRATSSWSWSTSRSRTPIPTALPPAAGSRPRW